MALYSRYSDIITDLTTAISWTSGTESTSYPVTNLYDRKAHSVAKITGSSGTLRVTYASAKTLEGIALVNTNATAVQITNAAGLNQAMAIPTTPEDGLRLDPWIDLRSVSSSQRSSTQWDFAITSTGAATVGELLLLQTLRTLKIVWDPSPQEIEGHPASILETDYGVRLKYGMGVRRRQLTGTAFYQDVRADVLALQRDARGAFREFALIWDTGRNDCAYGDLSTPSRTYERIGPNDLTRVGIEFVEAQKGLAL